MISRRHLATLVLLPTALFLVEAACNRVPLLAPSGSSITLTSATSVLAINGTATVTAQVLENAGTPPQAGTHVIFTTSLGTVQPSEATTDSGGRASATFTSTSSGTATITAVSGGASVSGANGLKILVGTAAAQKVAVSATPATIPSAGGSSTISAVVFDVNGSFLAGVPVTFSSTAGTLSDSIVTTDAGGAARSILTTSVAATVTGERWRRHVDRADNRNSDNGHAHDAHHAVGLRDSLWQRDGRHRCGADARHHTAANRSDGWHPGDIYFRGDSARH